MFINSVPLSVCSFPGFLSAKNVSKASIIDLPVLFFNGTTHAYFDRTSMHVRR